MLFFDVIQRPIPVYSIAVHRPAAARSSGSELVALHQLYGCTGSESFERRRLSRSASQSLVFAGADSKRSQTKLISRPATPDFIEREQHIRTDDQVQVGLAAYEARGAYPPCSLRRRGRSL